ncbi:glycosyltransferase [Nocardia aurantia]|uniref:Glycosyl transferase family 28 C-terminal domain-containing protein n=1 Tax=Nocardia aurantia TaxID=2585199 RepID=A0A7K0DSI1_9NOCA|nr:glycosyltransferase [Nocardia aurantia]MQY27784.1 hypothetical protein [Nocardia aurantia]
MIGYYIHHQGRGHLARAQAICARLSRPVTVLTSLPDVPAEPFAAVVTLPADDEAGTVTDVSADGALHWVPRRDDGLRTRMAALSAWIAAERPAALVADVSVEVALLARLHGIPVVTVALPGERTDPAHVLVHRISDAIIAAWPGPLYRPEWLGAHRHKTGYVGGISRYSTRPASGTRCRTAEPTILVLSGRGGSEFTAATVRDTAERVPGCRWQTLGLESWTADPWPRLCDADLVVAHAGQGAVADIAAAGKPAVLIPAARPFGEQHATAHAVAAAGLAVTVPHWPPPGRWPALIDRALTLGGEGWARWEVRGAPDRAAATIAAVADRG